MTNRHPIIELIELELKAIEARSEHNENVSKILSLLRQTEISEATLPQRVPQQPLPDAELDLALSCISESDFPGLRSAIEKAKPYMWWKPFIAEYYTPSSDLGAHFMANNMFCDLIGPLSDAFFRDNVRMGIFLMPPNTHYRDHVHEAAELYVTTTGPSGWRMNREEWFDLPSNSCVWNDPWRIHAMRTYDRPLLTLYGWFGDVGRLCETKPTDGWEEMETNLQSGAILPQID